MLLAPAGVFPCCDPNPNFVSRVCKRWKRLVKDQRLWRNVDLTSWKGVRLLLGMWLYHFSFVFFIEHSFLNKIRSIKDIYKVNL